TRSASPAARIHRRRYWASARAWAWGTSGSSVGLAGGEDIPQTAQAGNGARAILQKGSAPMLKRRLACTRWKDIAVMAGCSYARHRPVYAESRFPCQSNVI